VADAEQAPDRIYLQWSPCAGDEVTWCWHRIDEGDEPDVEYVRADLAPTERERAEEAGYARGLGDFTTLEAERDRLQAEVTELRRLLREAGDTVLASMTAERIEYRRGLCRRITRALLSAPPAAPDTTSGAARPGGMTR
jgi:hypothetical protein